MKFTGGGDEKVREELNQWNVLIEKKSFKVILQRIWISNPYRMSQEILRLTFSYEDHHERFEFNDHGSPDNVFEFENCRFLFRRNRDRRLYDLYIDGKLIY